MRRNSPGRGHPAQGVKVSCVHADSLPGCGVEGEVARQAKRGTLVCQVLPRASYISKVMFRVHVAMESVISMADAGRR